ncbi:MAG: endopeptidase La [Acidiferrobacter sp.]
MSDPESMAAPGGTLARAGDVLPTTLAVVPITNRPFFPAQAIPLVLDRDPWSSTIAAATENPHKVVGLVLIRKDQATDVVRGDFYDTGTVCRIHKVAHNEDKLQVFVEGLQRFHVDQWVSDERPFAVRARYFAEPEAVEGADIKAYSVAIINTIKELLPLNPLYGEELKFFLTRFGPDQPSRLGDFAASLTTANKEELQDVLRTVDLEPRLEKVLFLLRKELDLAKIQARISERVEEKINEQQRQFFLREQLKAIQKELGIAKDDRTAEIEAFRERLTTVTLPAAAQKRVGEELQKMAILEMGSPEYAVTRNYLEWLTTLPWGRYSSDKIDLKQARQVLDRDHDGLEDVKDRIIEFLAVGAMKGEVAGSILLLVGPPGVGKTSIGRSIAASLGRTFYRFSVGGMRDEAEIKGHRRTYVGAMPGKFIQAIREVGVANPIIMLDEIDKIGSSYQGNPASALLEVLDPEQNVDFLDHYLDLRFDFSKVLFICTANQLDTIPRPLLDRMEVIRLAGYITSEKMAIAKHHLLPKQMDKVGLKRGQLRIEDQAIREIIEGYAREAGVRNLEKKLGSIARKAVVAMINGKEPPIKVSARNLEEYLDRPVFQPIKPLRGVGVVTGLAWTPMGGAILDIEVTRVHRANRGIKITGQLGEVMRESAEIAYSYISSHCKQYHCPEDFFDKASLHLHVPAGAIPKDGPSAGITIASALLSLARGKRLVRPLAMTGELTLTGYVLPVGGIREKIIAARRVKISEIIIPEANRNDFEELPDNVRSGLAMHYVKHYRDVAALIFPE